jgi:hypothetical protein
MNMSINKSNFTNSEPTLFYQTKTTKTIRTNTYVLNLHTVNIKSRMVKSKEKDYT